MSLQTQEITLDIMDNKIYETMYSKQYDEGRQIVFHITENGQPFDTTGVKATIQMKKPDGSVVINDCILSNNQLIVTLTNQMTICAGNRIPFQIQLIKVSSDSSENPVVLTTVTGYLKVSESVVHPDDVVSSDEFNALTHALIKVEELNIKVTNAEEIRESNENARKDNEDIRMANETNRQSSEDQRQTDETNRINAENNRNEAENTRQSNETTRQSNESKRQSDTSSALTNVSAATTNCINATNDLQNKLDHHYFVLNSDIGTVGGVAELDENGHVPSSQLPSYVDDVIEGYNIEGIFYKDINHSEVITGETGKIYVDLETNKTYRWSGSAFVVISETLALGETASTAYRGDWGKTAYDHSQAAHARIDATKVENSETNGNIKINDNETTVYTHPESGAIAGSYGDASNQSLAAGETFKVPYMTVDEKGHITEVSEHTVTLPTTPIVVDDALSTDSTNPVENKVVTQAINGLVNIIYPVGSIYMSVNATNPSVLFGGTWVAWGSGRVPVGVNASETEFATVEKTGGEKKHTLTVAELASHTHTFTGSSVNTGNQSANHTHSIPALSGTATGGNHRHIAIFNPVGSGDSFQVDNAKRFSNQSGFAYTGYDGGHTHSVTTNVSNTGNNSVNHTHTVTAKGSNSKTGSGTAHNNLQPYITCYMWKRTA